MRFNIDNLCRRGFHVSVKDDEIHIESPAMSEAEYTRLRNTITERIGDAGLQDYVMGAYLIAYQRAQILEAAE